MRFRLWVIGACTAGLAGAMPPNTSLATLPVGYYGGSWPNKTDVHIDLFSRMRFVTLMQQDGNCWVKCCPKGYPAMSGCQPRGDHSNATDYPGCNPSCDQHGAQDAVFRRIQAYSESVGRPRPHFTLYMNAVYDWPFDAAHAGGNSVDVLDIHGNPHTEQCDPGIFPSFFLDYGRLAGRQAFLNAVEKYIVNGTADGVYLDCYTTIPLKCNKDNTSCFAIRNRGGNTPSVVTHAQVVAYTEGKQAVLPVATKAVIASKRGIFTAKTVKSDNPDGTPDPFGANTALIGTEFFQGSPYDLINASKMVFRNGYTYAIVSHGISKENRPYNSTESLCSEYHLASFLLAVREGMFIVCNGWDPAFDRPLGNPIGPATVVNEDGVSVLKRTFESGVVARWVVGSEDNATVVWPGVPPPPSPPPHPAPPPSPPTPPVLPIPQCPGPQCPQVSRDNYVGCYHDHVDGVCDLPFRPPHATGHCKPNASDPSGKTDGGTANRHGDGDVNGRSNVGNAGSTQLGQGSTPVSAEMPTIQDSWRACNSLCAPLGYAYFGVQAGHACFCGQSYGRFGVAPESLCNAPCVGNASEVCGGDDVNSVFKVVKVQG